MSLFHIFIVFDVSRNGYNSLFQWMVEATTPSVGIATSSSVQSGRSGNVDDGSLLLYRQRYTNQCVTFPTPEQRLRLPSLNIYPLSDLL